tara:strand:- start:179 stop:529 length:351 start_codon:yes stop_codon:yes gene_type:complete
MTKSNLANKEKRYKNLLKELENLKKQRMDHHKTIMLHKNINNSPHLEAIYNECAKDSNEYYDEKDGQLEALSTLLQYLEDLRENKDLSKTLDNECKYDINSIIEEMSAIENNPLYK